MPRKSSERLQTLLRLAALRESTAAKQLAQSGERLQQAELQKQQLQDYAQDYQQSYVEPGHGPVNRNYLLNYRGFFNQLDTAQIQQQRTVDMYAGDRELARQRWLQQYVKRQLLNRVYEQRLAGEERAVENKIQRELDDRAARPNPVGLTLM